MELSIVFLSLQKIIKIMPELSRFFGIIKIEPLLISWIMVDIDLIRIVDVDYIKGAPVKAA